MRIALLSDIHANREAFAACLAHAEGAAVDRYVFLGDYVGYGADPGWAIDTVKAYVERGALARISHRIECIGAANQRKSLCRNNLSPTHGAPRCRQTVPRISSNLHPSKDAKWSPRSTLVQ